MAKTLRETLQKQLEQPTPLPSLGQTEEVGRLLQAKSGRAAGPSSVPARSSQQELVAQANTINQAEQQQVRGALAGIELEQQGEQQEQQVEQQQLGQDLRRENALEDFERRAAGISEQLANQLEDIDSREQAALIEQVAQVTRLNSREYVQDLRQVAAEKQLEDEQAFKMEAYRTALDDDIAMFKDDLSFRAMMDSDERAFNESIQMLSAEDKLRVAELAIDSAKTTAMWQGVAGIGQGAARWWAARQPTEADKSKDLGSLGAGESTPLEGLNL